MNRALLKISALLLILIFIPLVIFSIYQLSTLNDNESALEEIYINQLESILFSVNQYSDDVISSWANRIERELISGKQIAEKMAPLKRDFPPVENIFLTAKGKYNDPAMLFRDSLNAADTTAEIIASALLQNEAVIERLFYYYKSGYRKIENLPVQGDVNFLLQLFVTQISGERMLLCGIVINKQLFISEIISRRIALGAGDKFAVAITSDKNDSLIFSNIRINAGEITRKRALWALKGYSVGIGLSGDMIAGITRERTRQSLILLFSVNILFVIGLVFVFLNIRKQIRLAQIKSDFVSNVSHELRTPLALITMFAETLEAGRVRKEEKKQEYYGIISAEAGRLSKIVNSILNFSQIESGKRKYHFGEVSLGETAEGIVRSYSYHLTNKGFEWHTEIDAADTLISGDKDALSEMIVNLIDNAIKYSESEKYLRVSVSGIQKRVELSVEDRGIGIAEKEREQIFEKFYRASGTMVHNTKGTGLGLAIVKHIVEAHKGKIIVSSVQGRGSKFTVTFPASGSTEQKS